MMIPENLHLLYTNWCFPQGIPTLEFRIHLDANLGESPGVHVVPLKGIKG